MKQVTLRLYYAPENRKKLVPLTAKERKLVNLIRASKGLGPIFPYINWSY